MIKYDPKSWFSLLTHAYSRRVMFLLLPNMLFFGLYSLALTYVIESYFGLKWEGTVTVHSLLGIVLGLFLVFRTNTAYDRWWEGRTVWGALVNNTRNLAIKLHAYLPESDIENRDFFARMIANYPYALKEHLRAGVVREEMEMSDTMADTMMSKEHPPNFIAREIFEKTNALYTSKVISGEQLYVINKEFTALTDILGKCERIRNTPIPYSYSMYMKKFIFLYIITLPFAFITTFHYWTAPVVMVIFYILVSTELIAEEIEDPFGNDDNDLPLDELSMKIRNNVKEILLK